MFSATFPKEARELAKEYISAAHVRFRVGRAGSTTANIKQTIIQTEPEDKREVLLRVLNDVTGVRTIIFANSRREVDNLDDFLFNVKLPVTSMHSDRTQMEREAALRSFRHGQAPILIATGVTARGIDVRNVMHVINYDLPSMDHGGIEEYTHRIGKWPPSPLLSARLPTCFTGRTGRIGHRGLATSFFVPGQDDGIADVLTRTLLETQQEVPDFLGMYVPEGEAALHPRFETESDYDPDEAANQDSEPSATAWGQVENGASGTTGWGSEAPAATQSNGLENGAEDTSDW